MVKFVGAPVDIPVATASTHAVQRAYVDAADLALAGRVTTLESGGGSSGGQAYAVRSVSASATAVIGDFVLADATSAALTITLPSAPATNKAVIVKKVDASTNLVTVVGQGGTKIDGDTNLILLQPQAGAEIIFDGSNWRVAGTVIFDPGARNLTFRGAWSNTVAYAINDVVYYGGNSFVAIVAQTGNTPPTDVSNSTWGLLTLHGAAGTNGSNGSAATVAVGTTTTGAAGSNAAVTNSGTTSAAVLNFTVPAGAAGTNGTNGSNGSAATVAVGTTTTGAAGSSATVTNSGTSSAAVLNFTVPQGTAGTAGSAGAAATVAVGTTTTGAPGSNASVTNSGTSSAAVFNFTVPQGAAGAAGTAGSTGPGVATGGTTGQVLAKASNANYDTTWTTVSGGGGGGGARTTATYTTSGAVAGTNYTGSITMATGYRILAVQTSAAARVRLYTDAASQTADVTRATTTLEPDNAGLVLDYLTTGTTLQKIAPSFAGYSMETVPSTSIPITVTPTGATTVTVTVTYVGIE